MLKLIHPEVQERFYGCGLVAPELLEDRRLLDLGCGSGRDCYLLSALAGPNGAVIGVDMTPEQLDVARRHSDYHRDAFGYARSNVTFMQGRLEHLDRLPLAPGSFDLVVPNCVLNLCEKKPEVLAQVFRLLRDGGEFYFSGV